MSIRDNTERQWRRQGGELMGTVIILALSAVVGLAILLSVLAWQHDYETHGRLIWSDCAFTLAIIAGALMVLLSFVYFIAPIWEGR
jgi:hypothetical protein